MWYFATATPLFGGSAMLFHLANIGLHVATGLLLFALALAISGNSAYALLTALFFVVQPGAGRHPQPWTSRLWPFVPYGLLLAAYLVIDLQINRRNYVIAEGHYGIGPHVVAKALDYIVTL